MLALLNFDNIDLAVSMSKFAKTKFIANKNLFQK